MDETVQALSPPTVKILIWPAYAFALKERGNAFLIPYLFLITGDVLIYLFVTM